MPYATPQKRTAAPSLNLSLFDEPTLIMPVTPPAIVKPSFKPTDEQYAIGRGFLTGDSLCINAYAGTGKSSTLRYLVSLTNQKGELWCFNKRNALEAQMSFPKEKTLCCTSHSKAFRAMELSRSPLINDLGNKWPSWKIAKEFGISSSTGISSAHVANAALTCLRRWMHSADPELTLEHCWDALRSFEWFGKLLIKQHELEWTGESAEDLQEWKEKELPTLTKATYSRYRMILLQWAKELWSAMWNEGSEFPLEHDAYLKAWQLRKPKLKCINYLMVDEFQDTNDCVLDIILNQDCQLIGVGDNQQGLYEFRGATKAMDQFPGRLFYLTLSHRFGVEVAKVANAILQIPYPDLPELRGNPLIHSTIGGIDPDMPYAAIARTNGALFEMAIEAVNQQLPIHVIGSLKEAIDCARSVYGLYVDDASLVKNSGIKQYDDWETLTEEAHRESDLNRYVGLVKTYDQKLPDICTMLEKAGEVKLDRARVILTTSHRGKGLEFPQVRMLNDYSRFKVKQDEDGQTTIEAPDQEFHNLYVNATRTINRLQPNAITMEILDANA